MPKYPTALVMLAAGVGSRFGGRKLDADISGKPVGRWAAEKAEAIDFAKRIIVTPPTPPSFFGQLVGWGRVINPESNSCMTSSIRAAAVAASGCSRVVIILADMPFVESEHLSRLANGTRVAFTQYADGKIGVPAAFPDEVYGVLAGLPDGLSPAALRWDIGVEAIEPKSSKSLMDVDTVADLALARSMVSTRP